jgi:hypothetical protein
MGVSGRVPASRQPLIIWWLRTHGSQLSRLGARPMGKSTPVYASQTNAEHTSWVASVEQRCGVTPGNQIHNEKGSLVRQIGEVTITLRD